MNTGGVPKALFPRGGTKLLPTQCTFTEYNFNDPDPITGKKGYPREKKLLLESQPVMV